MAEGPLSRSDVMPGIRRVTELEADHVTELFTLAFSDDPTWGWAFADAKTSREHHRLWWALYMRCALPYGCDWLADDGGAASQWIPPAHPELCEEDEARVEPLLRRLVGSHADDGLIMLVASRQTALVIRPATTSACSAPIPTIGDRATVWVC